LIVDRATIIGQSAPLSHGDDIVKNQKTAGVEVVSHTFRASNVFSKSPDDKVGIEQGVQQHQACAPFS